MSTDKIKCKYGKNCTQFTSITNPTNYIAPSVKRRSLEHCNSHYHGECQHCIDYINYNDNDYEICDGTCSFYYGWPEPPEKIWCNYWEVYVEDLDEVIEFERRQRHAITLKKREI